MAWSLLLAAATAGALLAAAGAIVTYTTSDPTVRTAAALVPSGLLLLRGLVVYGVLQRARWALWTGGLLGLLSLPAPLLAGISLEAPTARLELTGASTILAWLNSGTGAFFLLCLGLLYLSRRR